MQELDKRKNTNKHSKKVFSQSIIKIDFDEIQKDLSMGEKINNDNNKNHTLNKTIRSMMNHPPIKFNLNFFKYMINHGARLCNYEANNSISILIFHGTKYIANTKLIDRNLAENNVLILIRYLISMGAKPSNSDTDTNTLTLGIQSKNFKIIDLILEIDAKPLNFNINDNNIYSNFYCCKIYDYTVTLTAAVRTNNLKIVRYACESGSEPDNSSSHNNTLISAVKTCDPEIVREILIKGAKHTPRNNYYNSQYVDHYNCLFTEYYNIIVQQNHKIFKNLKFNEMINLIMCSGAIISLEFLNKLKKKDILR